MTTTTDYASEFELDEDLLYLNHAAVAPWPARTRHAVTRFAEQNAHQGSLHYKDWLHTETRLRRRLAELINAPSSEDIALLKSTSEGLSVIAQGLEWQQGDNIVISNEEFPSNRIVWDALRPLGVELREVDLHAGTSPEQALFDAADRHTRLIAISSVQYASGLRMHLDTIGQFCRDKGILFCVDAIQSIGALRFDAQAIGAHFVVADGHKWMLGPEGLALFYCRADLREQLQLRQFGWHMVEHMGEFARRQWHPAQSARRFECGSPNMLGIHALDASISLLLDTGMSQVEASVLEKSETLFEFVAQSRHLHCLTDQSKGRYAGIVVVKHGQYDVQPLYEALMEKRLMCAARGGGIRLSPHFYTPRSILERAVELIETIRL